MELEDGEYLIEYIDGFVTCDRIIVRRKQGQGEIHAVYKSF